MNNRQMYSEGASRIAYDAGYRDAKQETTSMSWRGRFSRYWKNQQRRCLKRAAPPAIQNLTTRGV